MADQGESKKVRLTWAGRVLTFCICCGLVNAWFLIREWFFRGGNPLGMEVFGLTFVVMASGAFLAFRRMRKAASE
jgi:hypothetical protein